MLQSLPPPAVDRRLGPVGQIETAAQGYGWECTLEDGLSLAPVAQTHVQDGECVKDRAGQQAAAKGPGESGTHTQCCTPWRRGRGSW